MRNINRHNINNNNYWNAIHTKEHYEGIPKDRLIFYNQIIPWLDHGSKQLLEIGCASGYGIAHIKRFRSQFNCIGYDFSRCAIEYAAKKYSKVKFIRHNIIDTPIRQDFDYIIMLETLEHFRNPFDIVDKCLKHCREMIITVPAIKIGKRSAPGHLYDEFKRIDFLRYNILESNIFYYDNYLAIKIRGKI